MSDANYCNSGVRTSRSLRLPRRDATELLGPASDSIRIISIAISLLHYEVLNINIVDCSDDLSLIDDQFHLCGSDGRILASSSYSQACHWIGCRLSSSPGEESTILKALWGSTKDERTYIARYVRLVENWLPSWKESYEKKLEDSFASPDSPMHLLENQLRHQKLRHITMYNYRKRSSGNIENAVDRTTIADLLLSQMLHGWMIRNEVHRDLIVRTIPAIVAYTYRVRLELMDLFTTFLYDSVSYKLRASSNKAIASSFVSMPVPDLMRQMFPPAWSDDELTIKMVESLKVDEFSFKFASFSTAASDEGKFKRINRNKGIGNVNLPDSYLDSSGDGNADSVLQSLQGSVHEWEALDLIMPFNVVNNTNQEVPIVEDGDKFEDDKMGPDSGEDAPFSKEFWALLNVPQKRSNRKKQQIRSLVCHALSLLPAARYEGSDRDAGNVFKVVEFCAGGGYIGLALAYLRPDVSVYLTDMNAISLKFAEKRANDIGLTNVKYCRCELEHLVRRMKGGVSGCESSNESGGGGLLSSTSKSINILTVSEFPTSFNLGISLHACGSATDSVLALCIGSKAGFVVSPCCYGSMRWCPPCVDIDSNKAKPEHKSGYDLVQGSDIRFGDLSYPQSDTFKRNGWQPRWFSTLCSKADSTFWQHDGRANNFNVAGVAAMRAVDTDRVLMARERGYSSARPYLMDPPTCTTKNHILVGKPDH